MAYLKEIWTRCSHITCPSKATVTLHNFRNAQLGQFCRKHGESELRIQKDYEKSEMERERLIAASTPKAP